MKRRDPNRHPPAGCSPPHSAGRSARRPGARRSQTPELSVVIPVYRAGRTLVELYQRLDRVLGAAGIDFEVIFVEDDGGDQSWHVIRELRREAPHRITAVQLMRNCGQHNALMCGLRLAGGRLVVTMDDDLQHPPEEVPRLIEALRAGKHDVVYGVPARRAHRWWRNAGSALVAGFYRFVFRSHVRPSPFRIMRRRVVRAVLSYNLNYTYLDGLLAWHTRRISEVTVEHRARATGRSGYSLGKLVVLALNLFTNFSLLPLEVVSLLGIAAAALGLTLAAVFVLLYLFSQITVPGYASTIVAIVLFGGLQMLALGVLGEYVGRLHLNVNRKPQYTVRHLRCREWHETPRRRLRPADTDHGGDLGDVPLPRAASPDAPKGAGAAPRDR